MHPQAALEKGVLESQDEVFESFSHKKWTMFTDVLREGARVEVADLSASPSKALRHQQKRRSIGPVGRGGAR